MAFWRQLHWLPCGLIRVYSNVSKPLSHVTVRPTATYQSSYSKDNCTVNIDLTRDSNTTLCLHHATDINYELTKPIARPDPITGPAEQYDLVLKSCLDKNVISDKKTLAMEELSKMFYTSKHRWYPVGQYHSRRRNGNPPKER